MFPVLSSVSVWFFKEYCVTEPFAFVKISWISSVLSSNMVPVCSSGSVLPYAKSEELLKFSGAASGAVGVSNRYRICVIFLLSEMV